MTSHDVKEAEESLSQQQPQREELWAAAGSELPCVAVKAINWNNKRVSWCKRPQCDLPCYCFHTRLTEWRRRDSTTRQVMWCRHLNLTQHELTTLRPCLFVFWLLVCFVANFCWNWTSSTAAVLLLRQLQHYSRLSLLYFCSVISWTSTLVIIVVCFPRNALSTSGCCCDNSVSPSHLKPPHKSSYTRNLGSSIQTEIWLEDNNGKVVKRDLIVKVTQL